MSAGALAAVGGAEVSVRLRATRPGKTNSPAAAGSMARLTSVGVVRGSSAVLNSLLPAVNNGPFVAAFSSLKPEYDFPR